MIDQQTLVTEVFFDRELQVIAQVTDWGLEPAMIPGMMLARIQGCLDADLEYFGVDRDLIITKLCSLSLKEEFELYRVIEQKTSPTT